jgi:hypothetical protein
MTEMDIKLQKLQLEIQSCSQIEKELANSQEQYRHLNDEFNSKVKELHVWQLKADNAASQVTDLQHGLEQANLAKLEAEAQLTATIVQHRVQIELSEKERHLENARMEQTANQIRLQEVSELENKLHQMQNERKDDKTAMNILQGHFKDLKTEHEASVSVIYAF